MENKHPLNDGQLPQSVIDFFENKNITTWEDLVEFLQKMNDSKAFMRANFSEIYTNTILGECSRYSQPN